MCFSAPASFTAAAILVPAGIVSLGIAKPHQKLLAAIPLFFGIQQASEGFQWLAINDGHPSLIFGYIFLFFAFILWPTYVPVALYSIENKETVLPRIFIVVGLIVSLGLLITRLGNPLSIEIVGHSISYGMTISYENFHNIPFNNLIETCYVMVVLLPLLFARDVFFRKFALIIAMASIAARTFYAETYISTWCFFAAIVSSLILYYLVRERLNAK